MKIYDCHIHSNNSVDGKSSIDEICKTAIEKGAKLITITDHATPKPIGVVGYTHIENSIKEARIAAEKYKDNLKAFTILTLTAFWALPIQNQHSANIFPTAVSGTYLNVPNLLRQNSCQRL